MKLFAGIAVIDEDSNIVFLEDFPKKSKQRKSMETTG